MESILQIIFVYYNISVNFFNKFFDINLNEKSLLTAVFADFHNSFVGVGYFDKAFVSFLDISA